MSSIQLSCSATPFIGQKGRKQFAPVHIQTAGGSGFPTGALCFVRVWFVTSSKPVFSIQDITGLWTRVTNPAGETGVESFSSFNPVGTTCDFIAFGSFFDPNDLTAPDAYTATYRVEVTDDSPQRNVIDSRPVQLLGSATATQPMSVIFALDHGGSMGTPDSPGVTRLARLQAAFPAGTALLRPEDSVGVVGFGNLNCTPDVPVALALASSTQKGLANDFARLLQVDDSFPPQKPIQVGLERARAMSQTATVVLVTDGENNNTPGHKLVKPLLPTSALLITSAVPPQPNYNILVSTTGEYAFASAPLGSFAIEKLLAQILVGIGGGSIISDPEGSLEAGGEISFPLQLTEADRELEVIVLSDDADAIEVHFEGLKVPSPPHHPEPHSHVAAHQPEKPRVDRDKRYVITRLSVPELPEKERPFNPKVVISRSRKASHCGTLVRYNLIVAAKSDLKFDAQVTRSGTTVGSELLFSAVLSEYGQALHSVNTRVRVELSHPDGFSQTLELQSTPGARGRFQASLRSFRPGFYTAHFIATGQSLLHERAFRRELVRTSAVSEASGCCEPEQSWDCIFTRT